MLSASDNALLTRVGPGTVMGNLMREYWLPGLLSSELPTPDRDPVRLLLLGEKLVAFRDTSGKVGVVAHACPHRGASLFFGRNEEQGLRCVYHGWKFDVDRQCVDMPNEPAESDFKSKVKATAYPTRERNGLIWAYMGPAERAAAAARHRAEYGRGRPRQRLAARRATGCKRSKAISTQSTSAYLHVGS